MATIVLTGGGTAGHIMPNLALISELRKYFDDIRYVAGNGMETKLVPEYGLDFYKTRTVKLDRSNILSNLKIPFVLKKAISEASELLSAISPNVVFSKGGYASLPVCFAAKKLKIPVVIHESDVSFGLANKLVIPFAAAVLTSFETTKGGVYVGSPVRSEIFDGVAGRAIIKYKLDTSRPTVLVVGGSSGSSAINSAVYAAVPKLCQRYSVVHISGKCGNADFAHDCYTQLSFANDINDLYALASVVVSRAGANSLAELTALGKKTIAIPLPKGASRGDQLQNAEAYSKKGLISILPQEKLTADSLIKAVEDCIQTQKKPFVQRNSANESIVRQILKVMR